jgi:N-acetylglutamate synthase-like GNAT family acetyltransferase
MIHKYEILYVPPSGTQQHCQHSWIAYVDNSCIGHTHLQLEANKQIKFMDAWVHEDYRRQGIFRTLWDTRWEFVTKEYQGHTVYAWCKPKSLPLLLEKGFIEGDNCVYVERLVDDIIPPFEQCFVSC